MINLGVIGVAISLLQRGIVMKAQNNIVPMAYIQITRGQAA